MSILDRGALEASPLADLHAIASELSIDGYRRFRKAELIDAILRRQGGAETPEEPAAEEAAPSPPTEAEDEERPARRPGRRGGRGRGGPRATVEEESKPSEKEPASGGRQAQEAEESPRAEPEMIEGVVELLSGGSGFVRVHPPDPSDEDVYISSAQVRRCELVTGDRVSGPRRAPRRSERFASLLRVDTVNDQPATELADGVRFEDRPVAFPSQRLALPEDDPLLGAISQAAPIGRGSRVTITGPPLAGKTETLRRLAVALAGDETLQLWLMLVGVRPEELPEWQQSVPAPAVALSFGVSADSQGQAVEGAVEQVRRLVARGAHAVVMLDTLDGLLPHVVRKVLASARNVLDGGSLTVLATATAPLGAETTVVALEPSQGPGSSARIDESHSWTLRRELFG